MIHVRDKLSCWFCYKIERCIYDEGKIKKKNETMWNNNIIQIWQIVQWSRFLIGIKNIMFVLYMWIEKKRENYYLGKSFSCRKTCDTKKKENNLSKLTCNLGI